MIEELREFLSTDTKKAVFYSYLLGREVQSDIAESLEGKASISSIERITNILRYLGLLKKGQIVKNKQHYSVNWNKWVKHCFNEMGFDTVEESQIEEISSLIRDPEIVSYYFYLNNPLFLKFILEDGLLLKKQFEEDDDNEIPFKLIFNLIIKKGSNPADYPLYFLFSASPIASLVSKSLGKPELNLEEKKLEELLTKVYEENKSLGLIHFDKLEGDKILSLEKKLKKSINKIYQSKLKKENDKEDDEDEE